MKRTQPVHAGLTLFHDPPARAVCDGVPVRGYGYTWVLEASPDLTGPAPAQAGQGDAGRKVPLKKSPEISRNRIGVGAPRMPRTPADDEQPLAAIHLIDGDPLTCWSSRTRPHPEAEPVWIRLDLVAEQEIGRIVLRKLPPGPPRDRPGSVPLTAGAVTVGRGLPGRLEIRLSRDALAWETVFAGETRDTPDRETFECVFPPRRAKQIWIIGTSLVRVENWLYAFSIAGVEVCNTAGEDVARATRGTGVTVSSTLHGHGQEIEAHRWYWPLNADIGAKYVRVGYHNDPVNWHRVEKIRGAFAVDPEADAAITWLARHRIDTVMALGFGNRLYTQADPARHLPQLWECYYENPAPPTTPDALDAWRRYVRFMAVHFGSRVRYFELWNEWNIAPYWGDKPDVAGYLDVARAAIPVLREAAPRAKIMNGSTAGFCFGMSGWSAEELARQEKTSPFLIAVGDLLPHIDVVGWHPFYQADPDTPRARNYAADIRAFQRWCRARGFRGEYMATEWGYASNYPATMPPNWWGTFNCTELEKAKYVARLTVIHVALGVASFFNELWTSTYPLDISLLRRAFMADPITPLQPAAAYYVVRNLATAIEGVRPSAFACRIEACACEVECVTMRRAGERLVALWRPGRAVDNDPGTPATLRIRGRAGRCTAYDPMNGREYDLETVRTADGTQIPQLLVRDSPLLVRILNLTQP